MKTKILFITGTDTGVGKTVFAALLTRRLRDRGVRVVALKPICSGGRGDARALREAAGNVLPLDEVNPWHFRAPLAPLLAARKETRRVRLRELVAHTRRVAKDFDLVVVEGAGGLLSPLGEGFDSLDLLLALQATPIVVCLNRLGAVNQSRLVLKALPPTMARTVLVVLMADASSNVAARNNAALLGERIGYRRIYEFPRLKWNSGPATLPVQALLDKLIRTCD